MANFSHMFVPIFKMTKHVFRLHLSPKFKVNEHSMGLSKRVAEFQNSNIEEILKRGKNRHCHLDECHENNPNDGVSGK